MTDKYSPQGIPIVTLSEKLEFLNSCFAKGALEDAACHLCDLLEYCRTRTPDNEGRTYKDLRYFVANYGGSPTKIKED